jgi:hypothetical protein
MSLAAGFDQIADILGELGVLVLPPRPSAGNKVAYAFKPMIEFSQALGNGRATPTESTFGTTLTATTQVPRDLSLEQPPLIARQKFRGTTQHRITTILGIGHDRALAEMPADSDSLHSHISIDGAPQWVQ